MSKYLDSNGLLYFWQKLKTALGTKVDAVAGKGLSTNDYTTAEKTKLEGVATGANAYTHPSYTSKTSALYKVTVDGQGHVSAATAAAACANLQTDIFITAFTARRPAGFIANGRPTHVRFT